MSLSSGNKGGNKMILDEISPLLIERGFTKKELKIFKKYPQTLNLFLGIIRPKFKDERINKYEIYGLRKAVIMIVMEFQRIININLNYVRKNKKQGQIKDLVSDLISIGELFKKSRHIYLLDKVVNYFLYDVFTPYQTHSVESFYHVTITKFRLFFEKASNNLKQIAENFKSLLVEQKKVYRFGVIGTGDTLIQILSMIDIPFELYPIETAECKNKEYQAYKTEFPNNIKDLIKIDDNPINVKIDMLLFALESATDEGGKLYKYRSLNDNIEALNDIGNDRTIRLQDIYSTHNIGTIIDRFKKEQNSQINAFIEDCKIMGKYDYNYGKDLGKYSYLIKYSLIDNLITNLGIFQTEKNMINFIWNAKNQIIVPWVGSSN